MALIPNRMITTAPTGQDLAIFSSRESAEEAINYLKSKDFPIQNLVLQERGLTRSNQVLGTVTWSKAMISGFIRGLIMGIFFALLFMIWKPALSVFAPLVVFTFAFLRAIERLIAWAIHSSATGAPIAFSSAFTAQEQVLMVREDYFTARRFLLDNPRFQTAVIEQDTPTAATNSEFGSGMDEQPRFGVRLSPDARRQLREQQTQLKDDSDSANNLAGNGQVNQDATGNNAQDSPQIEETPSKELKS